MRARERRLSSPLVSALRTSVKVFLVLAIMPALVAWDLPWLSNRQRGDNDFKAGRYAEAIEHFKRAVEQEGNDWKLLYDLGTSYYQQGMWENAVEELSYADQIAGMGKAADVDRAHILHNLGLAYLQLDDCEKATPALEQAAQLDPQDQDLAKNAAFAKQYCSQQGQGQSQQDQGQGQSEQNQDQNQQNQGQGQSQQNQNQDQQNQGQGQSQQNQDQQNQDQQNQGQGQENNEQGNNSGNAPESRDNADAHQGGSGSQNDGLNLSDAQIEEILKWMSQRERDLAPQYFHNGPTEGDYLDDESMVDLFRRLFLGLPDPHRREADDGVDW